ncbi:MAG: hypothetical protein HYV07_32980, partial [Deltaproteobacteria bacterium]|nr:hypothetical protein [Deltaproteobacteria bacterium]
MLTAGAGLGAVESERGRIAEAERLKATTSVLVARNQWAAAVGELN